MDPRVKPAGDAERCVIAEFLKFLTQSCVARRSKVAIFDVNADLGKVHVLQIVIIHCMMCIKIQTASWRKKHLRATAVNAGG